MRSITCVVFVLACGGGKQPDPPVAPAVATTAPKPQPAQPAKPTGPSPYGGATYAGARFDRLPAGDHTAQLKQLYDQIRPLAGPATAKRRTDACAANAKLAAAARAIAKAPVPAGAHEVWAGEALELQAITEDMGPNCAGGDAGTIDFDIDSMHRSFQRLLKALPSYKGPK